MYVLINDKLEQLDIASALSRVSAQRREKALKFRFEQGQRESLAAYMLLTEGLKQFYGIDKAPVLVEGEDGKPMLRDYSGIHFNLSHCREAAICVIAGKEVGVDIEKIRPYNSDLGEYVLNGDELKIVDTSPCPDIEFIKFWTRKEAWLKYTGRGIREDLKEVLTEVDLDRLHTTVCDRYVYSICIAQPIQDMKIVRTIQYS